MYITTMLGLNKLSNVPLSWCLLFIFSVMQGYLPVKEWLVWKNRSHRKPKIAFGHVCRSLCYCSRTDFEWHWSFRFFSCCFFNCLQTTFMFIIKTKTWFVNSVKASICFLWIYKPLAGSPPLVVPQKMSGGSFQLVHHLILGDPPIPLLLKCNSSQEQILLV